MRYALTILLFCAGLAVIQAQTVPYGGAGITTVQGNPNNVDSLRSQDGRYESMFAYDVAGGRAYQYVGTDPNAPWELAQRVTVVDGELYVDGVLIDLGGGAATVVENKAVVRGTGDGVAGDVSELMFTNGKLGINNSSPPATLSATAPAKSGRESLLSFKVGDGGVSTTGLGNGTSGAGLFLPSFFGYTETGLRTLTFRALTNTANANSGAAMLQFDASTSNNSGSPNDGNFSSVTRDIAEFTTNGGGKKVLNIQADGDLIINDDEVVRFWGAANDQVLTYNNGVWRAADATGGGNEGLSDSITVHRAALNDLYDLYQQLEGADSTDYARIYTSIDSVAALITPHPDQYWTIDEGDVYTPNGIFVEGGANIQGELRATEADIGTITGLRSIVGNAVPFAAPQNFDFGSEVGSQNTNGYYAANRFIFAAGNSTFRKVTDAEGAIGIGDNIGASLRNVTGSVFLGDRVLASNSGALNARHTVALGYEALNGSGVNGADSIVAIGPRAGRLNTRRRAILLGTDAQATQDGHARIGRPDWIQKFSVGRVDWLTGTAPAEGQSYVYRAAQGGMVLETISGGGGGGTADGVVTNAAFSGSGSNRTLTLERSVGGDLVAALDLSDLTTGGARYNDSDLRDSLANHLARIVALEDAVADRPTAAEVTAEIAAAEQRAKDYADANDDVGSGGTGGNNNVVTNAFFTEVSATAQTLTIEQSEGSSVQALLDLSTVGSDDQTAAEVPSGSSDVQTRLDSAAAAIDYLSSPFRAPLFIDWAFEANLTVADVNTNFSSAENGSTLLAKADGCRVAEYKKVKGTWRLVQPVAPTFFQSFEDVTIDPNGGDTEYTFTVRHQGNYAPVYGIVSTSDPDWTVTISSDHITSSGVDDYVQTIVLVRYDPSDGVSIPPQDVTVVLQADFCTGDASTVTFYASEQPTQDGSTNFSITTTYPE